MQGAYDTSRPNGSSRRKAGVQEAIHVYRLYQKQGPFGVDVAPSISVLSSVLNPVRQATGTARDFIRESIGSLQGRLLIKEFRVPLIVEGLDKAPEIRTHFSYLQEGYFLDTPFGNAKGITHFRVRGRTHRTATVNGVIVDGDSALKEFAEMIDDYFFPANGKTTADFELYFIDLFAPISAEDPFGETEWLIHPLRGGVRQTMTSQRPFTRMWQFDFVGLQSNRDREKAEGGFWASTLSRSALGGLLEKLGLDGVVSAVTDVFGTLDDVKGLFEDIGNAVTAVTDYVQGVQDTIRVGIGKIRGILSSIQTVIGRIEDGIDLARNLPNVIDQDLSLLPQNYPGLTRSTTPGIVAVDELRRVRDFFFALAAQPQNFAPALSDAGFTSTVPVAIEPGATIEQLAQDHGVSVDELIRANDLTFPFIDARPRPDAQIAVAEVEQQRARDRYEAAAAALGAARASGAPASDIAHLQHQVSEALARASAAEAEIDGWIETKQATPTVGRVLYAGDVIKVPKGSASTPPSIVQMHPLLENRVAVATGSSVTEEDRLFGIDVELDDEGNLVWDDDAKDIRVERGLLHMARVQVRYVKLPLGALRYAPGIGNFAFEDLGAWQGTANNQLLAYAMFKTLQQDPRIRKIRNVRAETFAGVAQLSHDVELINGQIVPDLRVPVP